MLIIGTVLVPQPGTAIFLYLDLRIPALMARRVANTSLVCACQTDCRLVTGPDYGDEGPVSEASLDTTNMALCLSLYEP